MATCKVQESKKKARRSINCIFLGGMMLCGIKFVNWAVKLGKSVNEILVVLTRLKGTRIIY